MFVEKSFSCNIMGNVSKIEPFTRFKGYFDSAIIPTRSAGEDCALLRSMATVRVCLYDGVAVLYLFADPYPISWLLTKCRLRHPGLCRRSK